MLKGILWTLFILLIAIVLYFVAWPVPVEPVAWEAPPNPGYTGPFAVTTVSKVSKPYQSETTTVRRTLPLTHRAAFMLRPTKGV